MRKLTLFLVLLPGIVAAQGMRDGDRVPNADELAATLGVTTLTFYDGSTASFRPDGRYAYRYTPEDSDWVGRYDTGAEGQVCVTFDNGSGRCDTYVEAGGRLVLFTAGGLRFPVRSVEPKAQ